MRAAEGLRRFGIKAGILLVVVSCCFALARLSESGTSGPGTPADKVAGIEKATPLPPPVGRTAATTAYPLKVSTNRRYLVDQNDKPFRIQGDSAQSLISNLTYEEAEAYLSDRQAKGFNSININLLEHKFAVNASANRRGDAPFSAAGNFATPNEAYFAFADSIIDLAASKGMLVSLAAMYLGYDGRDEGWWAALNNSVNTRTVCYNFGLYIGKRYKDRKNILWVIGGDYLPPTGSEGEARLHKFMEGVKAAGATQLWAGDWNAPCISTDEKAFASAMDVNAVYTLGIPGHTRSTYGEARKAYDYSPTHPAYLKETGYENENWIPGDAASVRMYEYWAILGGSTAGGFFGNRDIWEFATAKWWSSFDFGHSRWQEALDSTGSLDMMRLGQLLDAVPWYNLVPSGQSGMKNLVSEGGGTYGELDYVTAAATADGKVLLAYIPPTAKGRSSVTVDMRQMRGHMRARWFDPTSGKYEEAASYVPKIGRMSFATPGKNSGGATDWILVLQASE
ncbi:MAG TPA: DUF4038 domain-containing protein [Candidatus Acidoferrum sp.]|nr:DUF4038 domain-containing protein [Candidatus Acidoferrum sp.]